MKWILAALALSLSFMMGCQCTEKATDMEQPAPAEMTAPAETAPTETAPPAEGTEVPAEGTEGGTEAAPTGEGH